MDFLKKLHLSPRIKDLVESSFQERFEDGRGLQTASAAVLLAEKDPTVPGDLRVAAWTQFGNALRLSGKFREAEVAFSKASTFLTSESDPRTRANLLETSASLHRVRGRFNESEECLSEAIEIYDSLGDTQAQARELISLGILYFDFASYPRSLSTYQTALSLLNEESDPILYVSACHGLVATLWACGRPEAAVNALAVAEPVFRAVSNNHHLVGKITWLKARVYFALGDKASAIEAYTSARKYLSGLSDGDLEVLDSELAAAQA